MKALVLEEYGKVVIKDVPKPMADGNMVLIRIKAASICGSDVHGYDGSSGRRRPPLIMGHEASGVVEEVGSAVKDLKPGDRVTFNSTEYCGTCNFCARGKQNMCLTGKVFGVSCDAYHKEGAMAEYIAVPDYIVYRVPEGVSFVEAALTEPLAIALHAVNRTEIMLGDTAIVFGAGTIGSMVVKLLQISNCSRVILVDIDQAKLDAASARGVQYCINSAKQDVVQEVMKLTDGKGADIAFEAVGIAPTILAGIDALKKCGRFTLLGNVRKEIDFPLQKVVIKELSIIASYACTTEYEKCLELIGQKKINVLDVVSETVPAERGQEMFQRLLASEKGLIKAVLTF
jgi:threonine dehydrogenase-like Zn-dependent dehydrogenase